MLSQVFVQCQEGVNTYFHLISGVVVLLTLGFGVGTS